MSESFFLMLILALGGGNGGDLLDFAKTEDYWQAREQRIVDVQAMAGVLADEESIVADKLMAIRALGELGKAEGADPASKATILEKLTPLVDSKEPFVGQYAKRSIAWVKGEDPAAPAPATNEQLNADLAILPHTSQIIGQARIDNGVGPIDWTKLLPDFKNENMPPRDEMIAEITGSIAEVAGMIGNARIDSVTVGGQFIGNSGDGYVVVVARGKYDRVAVQIAIQDMAEQENNEDISFFSIGEVEVIINKGDFDNFAILMPSDEVIVFMFGESDQGIKLFPIDETADLLQKGDGQIAFNETVTKQLSQIDRTKAVAWVAMQVPSMMREMEEEIFGSFEAGHAYAVRTDDGMIDIAWKVEADNAEKLTESVKLMNEGLNEGRTELREMIQREPEMKPMFEPMIKMMDSLHVESEGKTMTGGMQVPANAGSMMPMMLFGMAPRHHQGFEADVAIEDVAVEVEEAVAE